MFKIEYLSRIYEWEKFVYVEYQHEIYQFTKKHRVICSVPEASNQGLKFARLYQVSWTNGYKVLICHSVNDDICLKKFLKTIKSQPLGIIYKKADVSHPLFQYYRDKYKCV